MKNYLILHYGFEMPSEEDMAKWNAWFASIADVQVGQNGLMNGNQISVDGVKELPFGKESLTGYTLIQATSLEAATEIAKKCPIVLNTQVYEVREQIS